MKLGHYLSETVAFLYTILYKYTCYPKHNMLYKILRFVL